jgi:hypothetical protein
VTHAAAAVHEFSGNLLHHQHDDAPYWALRRFIKAIDGGVSNIPIEIDGEHWDVTFYNQDSGLEPRRSDDVENLYEYRLNADGEDERKLRALIQPRLDWDDPSRRPNSVPRDLGPSVNVRSDQSSNIHPRDFQALVPQLLAALADEIGVRWRSDYFTGDLHEYSTVTQLEAYYRVEREHAKKAVQPSGVFRRLWDTVSDLQGSKVVFSADNTEIIGYNQQLRFDQAAAREIYDGLTRGPRHGHQLKHYHPKHVRSSADDDDPLYHPKIGALYKSGLNDGTAARFADVDDLVAELEENLVNVLEWAGIPTEPGTPAFVPDDHFDATESERTVEIGEDPTPEIEREQDSILVRTLGRLTERDLDVLQQVSMTDGGTSTVDAVADGQEYSTRTVYRALSKLDELLDLDNGEITFISEHVRARVRDVVGRVQDVVDAGARIVEDVLGLDERDLGRKSRAFQRWLTEYGIELVEPADEDGPMRLRARHALAEAKSLACPDAREIAHHGFLAFQRTEQDPGIINRARLEFQNALSGTTTVKSIRQLRRQR